MAHCARAGGGDGPPGISGAFGGADFLPQIGAGNHRVAVQHAGGDVAGSGAVFSGQDQADCGARDAQLEGDGGAAGLSHFGGEKLEPRQIVIIGIM